MKNIIRIIFTILFAASTVLVEAEQLHCNDDSVKVTSILREISEPGAPISSKMLPAARLLIGTPYSETTMADSVGSPVVDLHAFDQMGFLVSVAALAKTATGTSARWRDYARNLESLGWRKGVDKGFASRLIYGADWINDNYYRGNVKELTERGSNPIFKTKSLDYVTRHKDDYRALSDSVNLEQMKMVEMGLRLYKIPHLKKEALGYKDIISEMQDGDIIMLLSNEPDRDIYEVGILEMKNDGPHIIYASRVDGKVVEMNEPLLRFAKRETKRMYGFRWLRMVD